MSIINSVTEVLHRIRVKLYANYLPQINGAYIARTNSEASLNIEQVCAALKNRGGFNGGYEELVNNVSKFFDEAAYQLCDGFSVNTGYFSVYPNIGGTFDTSKDPYDPKKNPLNFRFRTNQKLRNLAQHITVDIEGIADTSGYIDMFTDVEKNTVNETLTACEQFIIMGHKVKIAGDSPECGIYFQLVNEPDRRIKVTTNLAENAPSRIIGMAPVLVTPREYRVVIVTQYNGSRSSFLKKPRTMTGSFELSAA